MFNKIIKKNHVRDIRYGQTKVSSNKTIGNIMDLLDKHGCEETLLMKSKQGFDRIGFMINNKSYIFTIPKVYIQNELNERIGPRLLFRFLETVLEFVKEGDFDFDTLFLASRVVKDDSGKIMNVADYIMPYLTDDKLLESGPVSKGKDFILQDGDESEEDVIDF